MLYRCHNRMCGALDCENCHPGRAAEDNEPDPEERVHGVFAIDDGYNRLQWAGYAEGVGDAMVEYLKAVPGAESDPDRYNICLINEGAPWEEWTECTPLGVIDPHLTPVV